MMIKTILLSSAVACFMLAVFVAVTASSGWLDGALLCLAVILAAVSQLLNK